MPFAAYVARIALPALMALAAPAWSQAPAAIDPALKAEAATGDPAALIKLAYAYDAAGQQAEAIPLLKQAAAMNTEDALNLLIDIYFRAPGPAGPFGRLRLLYPTCTLEAPRWQEGMDYLLSRSEAGDIEAMLILAENARRGACGAKPAEAVEWFNKAAAANSLQAKARLAEMYAFGQIVPRDIEKARYWREAALRQADGAVARTNSVATLMAPDGQSATMRCASASLRIENGVLDAAWDCPVTAR